MDCIPGPSIRGDAQADFGKKKHESRDRRNYLKKEGAFAIFIHLKAAFNNVFRKQL
jgi:hypothetical protein